MDGGGAARGTSLLEDPEVAEQPPEKQEDEDSAEAAAAEALGAIAGREAA
jgi:hypothetical protein